MEIENIINEIIQSVNQKIKHNDIVKQIEQDSGGINSTQQETT